MNPETFYISVKISFLKFFCDLENEVKITGLFKSGSAHFHAHYIIKQ